jgi:NDP-sugar pyrophosphorylase family protein
MLTLAVTPIENAGRYGTVEFDAQGRLTAFREKAEHRHGWINGGVYIAARSLFDRIPPERNVSLETDVFPALAAQGLIATFRAEPPLLDMGTPSGIEQMESCLRRQGA